MTAADLSVKTDDFDTLGGRLDRAKDLKGLSSEQVAELVGVEDQTFRSWECDQALPRSNRLTMLAGILGVSPTWLLFGRGASPQHEPTSVDDAALELQLQVLKLEHQKISDAIEKIETSLRTGANETASQ